MPVLSNDIVNVTPVVCRTDMTLAEIRDALAARPPVLDGYHGGWASTNNDKSNMTVVNGVPPRSEPELLGADGSYPEMIRARYYYWTPVSTAVTSIAATDTEYRVLHGLDVLISSADAGRVSILVSTRNTQLLRRRDGAVRALEQLFRADDDTIRADFKASWFALEDADIFLWLAVKTAEDKQLDVEIKLDLLTGTSSTEASGRTADLRAGVDFDRPNFLTAVAEADTLGPIELSFVRVNAEGRSSFKLRLHADGGFEIHKSGVSYPHFAGNEDMMLRASYELAFVLIPRINALYKADKSWPAKRTQVISAAMRELSERYTRNLKLLEERLAATPSGSPAPEVAE